MVCSGMSMFSPATDAKPVSSAARSRNACSARSARAVSARRRSVARAGRLHGPALAAVGGQHDRREQQADQGGAQQ